MISSTTIISCCESTEKHEAGYDKLAVRLAYSIRKNAGALRDCPILMWYAEDRPPSEEYAKILRDFGCTLVSGPCIMPEYRLYNKITAMSSAVETEYALWLDSDVFVLRGLEGILEGAPDISTSPTTYSFHKWANKEDKPVWDLYYKAVGMENPGLEIKADIDDKTGLFYLCSGVVLFKDEIQFPKAYKECVDAILGTEVEERQLNVSQTALSLAVAKEGYSFKKLDERFQLVYSLRKTIFEDTALVHYQDDRVLEIPDFEWYAGGLL
jgi:hypothetical protein